ncbi:hypothetical protein TA3x_002531 [Tundrisphaera sp. TA3]|uniref:hypothetical protein n=1 Tax=Tundrisphaera sp. TA3 TaxID=3435775 RepID=UPI003EBEC701
MPSLVLALGLGADGGEPTPAAPPAAPAATPAALPSDIDERFRRLESLVGKQSEQIQRLTEENRRLADRLGAVRVAPPDDRVAPTQAESPPTPDQPSPSLPGDVQDPAPMDADSPPADAAPAPEAIPVDGPAIRGDDDIPSDFSDLQDGGNDAIPQASSLGTGRRYITGRYDQGFVLVAPVDEQKTPFSLKLNITTQVRYTGFSRSVQNWTDSTGQVLPVLQRNNIEMNRNWFSFTGFAFSPKLKYNATVFSTSTTNQTIFQGFVGYDFAKALRIAGGYYKIPGTREWTESARYPLGIDRSMANTFFRPSLSGGIWANGEPLQGVFYYAGVYNNFNAARLGADRSNNNMAYAANVWWEPLGEFGPGYSDEEYHENLVLRTGSSLTYQRSRREPDPATGGTNPEDTILRLSDGTPIYQAGALARGVTVTGANIALFSYDLSLKYRGFSLGGEYYGRWINGLDSRGGAIPQPRLNLFDSGGLAQVSYALIPKRFEVYARGSAVFGEFGDGSEYGGGVNWYIYSTRNVRGTFEVKRINHSPANNALYGYFAGESGTMYQVQILTDF